MGLRYFMAMAISFYSLFGCLIKNRKLNFYNKIINN